MFYLKHSEEESERGGRDIKAQIFGAKELKVKSAGNANFLALMRATGCGGNGFKRG